MTLTSSGLPPADAGAGAARTLIVRLRRERGSDYWRGQAICVQTGAASPISLILDDDSVAQLAGVLQQLLGGPSDRADR